MVTLKTSEHTDVLNKNQREAVEHIKSPTLVLAGAGSGKTRVLTYKIAYLVSRGIKPWHILAVTFTNKAAREMASRAEKLLNMSAEGLWIGTFHGICVRILRREAERWGFRRNFTIYDRDDQLTVVKKIMREMGLKKDRLNPSFALGIIGKSKNDFVSPDELHNHVSGPDAGLYVTIYDRYEALLRAAGAFDFDDLLKRPVEMFGKDSDALHRWQSRFKHILVDEYQDTNRTQYLLIKLLTGDTRNVTVVGDDDQSIYSWRGADIQNILGFERDFKEVKTIRLEENYRSTGTILRAANAVVANNKGRMAKKLRTQRPEGSPVKIIECWNDRDEAERVIRSIENEMNDTGRTLSDFVILYRTNAQSRSFEDVLMRRSISYKIVGGLKFYERKEVKDILAYLRFISNPDDTVSFARAVGVPKRGIGEKTLDKLEKYASEKDVSFMNALGAVHEITSGAMLNKLKEFHDTLISVSDMKSKKRLGEIVEALIEAIRYEDYLKKEYPDNFIERMANVDELISAMDEFENTTEDNDLSAYLANVSLIADVDLWDDHAGVLTLMTLHSAKGLEFPSVYIAGVERGLFPLPQSFEDNRQLEEERRLFYVGITRAEERVTISFADSRPRHGSFSGGASMFIEELPKEVLDFDRPEPATTWVKHLRNRPVRRVMEFEDYSQELTDFDESTPFHIGSYVRHPTFGRGRVLDSSGSGEDMKLTIQFGSETKKIMVKYARLAPA
ncbi:ATP-dependent helicase [Candidatus Latescibacterota bacterium]